MAQVGVIVARFQVASLTAAHIELLSTVGRASNRVIVFLGVTAVGQPTKNDPLDYETRRLMILEQFPNYSIVPIVDEKSYTGWDNKLDALIASHTQFDKVTLYGGRDSFLKSYKGKYPTRTLTLDTPLNVSGTNNRAITASNTRASEDFRAGVIYAILNSYTKVLPTVDIALFDRAYDAIDPRVLLGKRTTEAKWRFVGGHAEVEGSLEENAIREAQEEAHVTPYDLKYAGSTPINDWRYTGTPEAIKTTLFVGRVPDEEQEAATQFDDYDDIGEVKWHNFWDLTISDFEGEHQKLFLLVKGFVVEQR
jgi:bifunctional NMN adenylyltransferase/nudix hydrolase